MERLTYWCDDGQGGGEWRVNVNGGEANGPHVDRLAAIEDILGDEYDLGRLRELVEADRDGRCVVLPCGEGDRLSRGGLEYIADHWNITLTAFAKDAATKAGERLGIFSVEESEQAFKERDEDA